MSLIDHSGFTPPRFLGNGHLQTVLPALFGNGREQSVRYRRERIDTPDDDFLDLDWATAGAARVAILSHGLEGSSHRWYMRGMAEELNAAGWDVIAWNYRGCSGEPNRLARFYHSGATEDLQVVIDHALAAGYRELALVGFSLGGNITLKYLGEQGDDLDGRVVGAVAFSVPCDLRSSAYELARRSNGIYMRRFLGTLSQKVQHKAELLPGAVDPAGLRGVRSFLEFDDRYTAPLHGFRDAEDYWARSSSLPFLESIRVPALLINAANDPFLPSECYPVEQARRSRWLHLEIPASGGHVGFLAAGGANWMGERARSFLKDHIQP